MKHNIIHFFWFGATVSTVTDQYQQLHLKIILIADTWWQHHKKKHDNLAEKFLLVTSTVTPLGGTME